MNNKVSPKEHVHDVYHVNHHISDAFTSINPGTPFLFILFVSILAKLDHHCKWSKKYLENKKISEIIKKIKDKNNKDNPTFYSGIEFSDREKFMNSETQRKDSAGAQ